MPASSNRSAAYYRDYRAKRKADGKPLARSSNRGTHATRGKKLTKFQRGEFIAWDGEGYTRADGKHVYFLLANSLGEHISTEDPEGLSTTRCFDFLLGTAAVHPNAIHVCFGASYDVNMMLRDLPWKKLVEVWEAPHDEERKSVLWKRFYLRYHPRKELHLRDAWIPKGYPKRSIQLWDVFGFFQGTFVKAISEHLGSDYPDLELIRTNKAKRSQFTLAEAPEILDYCQRELAALVLLMGKLRDYCTEAEITLQSWRGAGSIAEYLLKHHKVQEHMRRTPKEMHFAVHCAYFGGRIEILQQGLYTKPVYNYDVNSAYPAAAVHLPSLTHGHWEHRTDGTRTAFSISHVRWRFTVQSHERVLYYPLPFRDKAGNVFFPPEGEGWYWEPEIAATLATLEQYTGAPDDKCEILESWCFVEDDRSLRPFAFINELFTLRAKWKAAGNMAHYVLKLGINSVYGKLAQQVGGTVDKPPAFHQLEWAGYITAFTRAQLLHVAATASQRLIMFTTDGIYSQVPLSCDVGTGLGQWETKTYDAVQVVQSGVYWTRKGEKWTEYCRGFDRDTISREGIIEAWQRGKTVWTAKSTRFITLGSGIHAESLREAWRTWRTIDRELSLKPAGKRRLMHERKGAGLLATKPRILPFSHSHPFKSKLSGRPPIEYVDGIDVDVVLDEVEETGI